MANSCFELIGPQQSVAARLFSEIDVTALEASFEEVEPRADWMELQFKALFQPYIDEEINGRFEIRAIHPRSKRAEAHTFQLGDFDEAIGDAVQWNQAGFNVYVGPNLRNPNVSPIGACKNDDVIAAAFQFADCDSGETVTALRDLQPYRHQVSIGTGIEPCLRMHAYWRQETVVRNLQAWSEMQKRIATRFGSDTVHDPARIMRLAGSVSYPTMAKAERGYRVEVVQIQVYDDRAPLEHADFLQVFPPSPQPAVVDPAPQSLNLWRASGRSDFDLHDMLEASRKPRQWLNNTRDVIASLVGRGLSDWEVRSIVGPYCDEGPDDDHLTPFLHGARTKWNLPNPDRASEGSTTPEAPVLPEERLERFRFSWWESLKADQIVEWLIKDLLPKGAFVVLYGKPGSFKSFVAICIAAFVAASVAWFGRAVKGGPVLYIACEGQAGLGLRREALRKKFNLPESIPLGFIRTQVDLCSPGADTAQIIELIQETTPDPALIVIDTLSRALAGGDENSPKDMGSFILNVGKLMNATGAAVLAIHHCGKDEARGMRGHSSLRGAVDTELEIVRHFAEDKSASITITKQKDGEDGLTFEVQMETVTLTVGHGVHAHEAKTLVAVPSDEVSHGGPQRKRTQRHYGLDLLRRAIEAAGGPVPGQPSSVRGVTIELWKAYCRTYHLSETETENAQRMAFKRAMTALQTKRIVTTKASYVWIN